MMVRIYVGTRSIIEPPFMILKNTDSPYPVRDAEDTIPVLSYQTEPNGWIDRHVINLLVRERRTLQYLP